MTTKIPFPSVPIGEWTPLRPYTASGLFVYRQAQALDLLKFPDFSGGDMTREQISEALKRSVYFQRPITALSIFLSVVSLEDFIRELGCRISHIDNLDNYFKKINALDIIPIKKMKKPSSRLFRDPFNILDFEELNKKYYQTIGINPIPSNEIPRLEDLAMIRHTVAHHGSMIRDIDISRFQYYQMTPNVILNPPIEFVNETCTYLYKTGSQFEIAIQEKIFKDVIPQLEKDWDRVHPKILVDLIEVFNFFGKFPTESHAWPVTEDEKKTINDEIYHELMTLCIKDIQIITGQ
jgi:hypothetical protein